MDEKDDLITLSALADKIVVPGADLREEVARLLDEDTKLMTRIVQLLVERVDISTEGADIRLRTQGLTSLIADLGAIQPEARRAA